MGIQLDQGVDCSRSSLAVRKRHSSREDVTVYSPVDNKAGRAFDSDTCFSTIKARLECTRNRGGEGSRLQYTSTLWSSLAPGLYSDVKCST